MMTVLPALSVSALDRVLPGRAMQLWNVALAVEYGVLLGTGRPDEVSILLADGLRIRILRWLLLEKCSGWQM